MIIERIRHSGALVITHNGHSETYYYCTPMMAVHDYIDAAETKDEQFECIDALARFYQLPETGELESTIANATPDTWLAVEYDGESRAHVYVIPDRPTRAVGRYQLRLSPEIQEIPSAYAERAIFEMCGALEEDAED